MSWRDFLFGRPLASEEDERERIGPAAAVAVLGLDALASAAYGPEALLTVLMPLGAGGLHYVGWLTAAIVGLLVMLALSYGQTIAAYPNGGGAYTVAKENLGRGASLFAGAALTLDYVLNVAVAVSAGVGAMVSAVPGLLPHTLPLSLGVLGFLTLMNLRGVRSTGAVFSLPTYAFVLSLFAVIAVGSAMAPPAREAAHAATGQAATGAGVLWLLLRAFANGCTAMTGVEAVSNGVPLFREPTVKHARRTLVAIIGILVVLLSGEAFLCTRYAIAATPPGQAGYDSILSQITAAVFGRGIGYHVTMVAVLIVLALSANTSFADFPRLCRVLAVDKFMPEPFLHRGRRLVFSYGILALSAVSAVLLVVFRGITDHLIPLFAIGALSAFTVSQAGMVRHWLKNPSRNSRSSLILNAAGACATFSALCVVLFSKFLEGAWISVLLVLLLMETFRRVRRHYDFLSRATRPEAAFAVAPELPPIAVVPVRRWDAVSIKGLNFATGHAREVIAVQILTADREVDDLRDAWTELAVEPARRLGLEPPRLVVLRSEYRLLFAPLLELIERLTKENPNRQITVVIPELVEPRWYFSLLHAHSAALMRALLHYRGGPQVVVVSVPWYLRDWYPERRRLKAIRRLFGRSAQPVERSVSPAASRRSK